MARRPAQDTVVRMLAAALALALLAASFSLVSPGMMSWDSIEQWNEALHNDYTDKHPPVMAWWWGWLVRHVWDDSAVLLLFHLGLCWGGIVALGRIAAPARFWPFICLGIWFVPPVMGMSVMLWKDTGMAFSWFLACALMGVYHYSGRRPGMAALALVVALLFYGTAVRYNAFTGLWPLCLWLVLCLRKEGQGWRVLLKRSLLLFAGIAASVVAFNELVISRHGDQVLLLTMMDDIDAVSHYTTQPVKPSALTPELTVRAYLSLLAEHPWYYLDRRGVVFSEILFRPREPYVWYKTDSPCMIGKTRFGIDMEGKCRPTGKGTMRAKIPAYLHAFAKTPLYRGITWLSLSLALFAAGLYCWWRLGDPPRLVMQVVLLNASSLMYMLPEFFCAPSGDFRYTYWTVMASVCSLFLWGRFLTLPPRRNTPPL